MRRLFLLTILLLTLCAGARATQITVSSFQPSAEWRYGGTSATLRISVSQGFLASTGEWIPASTSTNFYRTITCSISGTTITVPSFTLPSTTNGNPNTSRYKFQFFGPGTANTPRDVLFSNFQVPTILGTTITIGQLITFNQAAPAPPRPGFPDIQQVQALINAVVPAPKATTAVEGIGRVSVTPVDTTHPIFLGSNDPVVPSQSQKDAMAGTSGTPSSINKFVTNADTGTSGVSKVLRLNPSGQLPALDGHLLTGLSVGTSVFNVVNYGAVGDGTTDDTAAFNAAIAACNAAGKGWIYGPGGTYKITSTPTTISCEGGLMGDGNSSGIGGASLINFTSGSTNLLNISSLKFKIKGISLTNAAGSTPTAGYGINVTGSDIYQRVDMEDVTVYRFFHGVHQDGGLWTMQNCTISTSVDFQMFAENSHNDDAGDWVMDNVKFLTGGVYPPLALKLKNGGRISNVKILGTGDGIVTVSGANTSNLQISNTSIELFTGEGIHINGGTPAFSWANVQINQVELLPDPANTTNVALAASATQNLQLNNIKCVATVTPATACIAAATTSSNWSVGTIDLNGWLRDIQSGGSYTGTPLPVSAVSAETISSNKIAPQYQVFHLGAGLLKNIFLNTTTMAPYDNRSYVIYVVPDAAFTWDATGNLGNSGTAAVGRLIVAQYFKGDKWYLSQ